MRYTKFDIKNFKGIKYASLSLTPAGANVFTLIGLNESGKTTILEAIDDFGSSREGMEALYGSKRVAEYVTFVPKHLKANFTGDITVTAEVCFEEGDLRKIVDQVRSETGYSIDPETMPKSFTIARGFKFENSDFKSRIHRWSAAFKGRRKGSRTIRPVTYHGPEWNSFVAIVNNILPRVVYFPTFLFSIPSKIYLNPNTEKERVENKLYRQIVQDVASSLQSPLDVQTHIVDRILKEPTPAEQLFSFMSLSPDKQKQITATLNLISQHLTKTVFEYWGKVFSGNFKGKEIAVRLGTESKDGEKLIYLTFVLKDGPTEYDVSERSLGFRWFFSFLLFTLYRVFAHGARGSTLFLLDEPASNLHSRAQMQLLESFGRIASGSSGIMYSTHSHYMVNPEWLDQAFVVANTAIDYENPSDELVPDSPSTEVTVQRYRAFVGQNPTKTTYFQPVLDKLEATPSRLDLLKPSVLVEGKGDYFILDYGRRVLLASPSDYAIVPTRGATDMDVLIGLFLGWGVNFAICLDSDKAGRSARAGYISEWGIFEDRVMTLENVDGELMNSRIEDFLAPTDIDLIKERLELESEPTKSQIQLFFSESLARRESHPLSAEFRRRVDSFDKLAQSMLGLEGDEGSSKPKSKRRVKNG